MRTLTIVAPAFVLLPLALFPACSAELEPKCGKCMDGCESEERELSSGDELGWPGLGAAGASGAGGEMGGTAAELIATIEGEHETDARYIYDESLPPARVTISIEYLGDPVLIDYEEGGYCDEDAVAFTALIGLETSDGRFVESAEGTVWLSQSGGWSLRFEIASAELHGTFDPSEIEDLGEGDHLLGFSMTALDGTFNGQLSVGGPSRDHGDGVGSASSFMVLIIPAVNN